LVKIIIHNGLDVEKWGLLFPYQRGIDWYSFSGGLFDSICSKTWKTDIPFDSAIPHFDISFTLRK
jgi:hypothetical protein